MKKAVCLLSGGLDSATTLAIARQAGYECHALSFQYGQRAKSELDAAARVCKHLNAKSHIIFPLNIGKFGGSALTDHSIDVPAYQDSPDIPLTYVPARNTVMLSVALSYAETLNAEAIFIGVSAIDYSHYPDCRPEFIAAYQRVIDLATKATTEGTRIQLHTPLIHLSKAETILRGLSCGVDYSITVTCYQANDQGLACGYCDSCTLRKKGFREAGVADATRYAASFSTVT